MTHVAIIPLRTVLADRAAFPDVTDRDIADATDFAGACGRPVEATAFIQSHRGPLLECLSPACAKFVKEASQSE